MTGTLYSTSYTALEFERSPSDATRQNASLLVEKFLKEFGVFIVDVLDATFLKRQYFFLLESTDMGVR